MQYLPILLIIILVAVAAFVVERRTSFLSRRPSPIQLQAWGEQHLNDGETKQWLANLTAQEAKQLLRQLDKFCKEEKLDLRLLFADKFGNNEELRTQATDLVRTYLQAAHQRSQMHADLIAHRFFAAYEKSPKKKKHRELALDLYLRLIQENLVEAPSLSDSIMLNDRKQQKAAQTAILQVAGDNRAAFNAVLKSTLESNGALE